MAKMKVSWLVTRSPECAQTTPGWTRIPRRPAGPRAVQSALVVVVLAAAIFLNFNSFALVDRTRANSRSGIPSRQCTGFAGLLNVFQFLLAKAVLFFGGSSGPAWTIGDSRFGSATRRHVIR
jgi:hypothetical protein